MWSHKGNAYFNCNVPLCEISEEEKTPTSVEQRTSRVKSASTQKYLLDLVRKYSLYESSKFEHTEKAHCVLLYLAISIMYNGRGEVKNGLSLNVLKDSNIPVGAGLGSSAALCVASSAALLQSTGQITKQTCIVDEDLELINKWAFCGETLLHGTPSGVDNTVSTYGGAICFCKSQKSDGGGGSSNWRRLKGFPTLNVVVTNTKVPRETRALVSGVRQLRERIPELIESVFDSIETVVSSCVKRLKNSKLDEHFVGELMRVNHQLLNAIGVGHSSLNLIADAMSSRSGITWTKLTGAGGGGCAVTLVPSDLASSSHSSIGKLENCLKFLSENHDFDCFRTKMGGLGVLITTTTTTTRTHHQNHTHCTKEN